MTASRFEARGPSRPAAAPARSEERKSVVPICSRSLIVSLAGVALAGNALGYLFYFDTVWSYDKVMHLYTSFVVVLALALALQPPLIERLRSHPWLVVATLTAFGVALGFLWEIAEWVVDIHGYPMIIKGKSDTMIDLIADGVGAALASLWAVLRAYRIPSDSAVST